jgi:hypothetical protein
VLYQELSDTRGCNNDCGCDTSTVTCLGTVGRHSSLSCSNGFQQPLPANMCTFVNELALNYVAMPDGTCTALPATTNGTVTALEPNTICCTR